jgi:hypothetical protein
MTKGRGKDQPFGLTAYGYADEIVCDLLGAEQEEGYVSKEMQHGIEHEMDALLAYQSKKGITVNVPTEPILHDSLPIAGMPDGITADGKGIIEVKCPNNRNHLDNIRTGAQIELYYWQMQGYMLLTGAEYCDFVSYSPRFPESLQLAVYRVERDTAHIADLTARINSLWAYVQEQLDLVKSKTV